MKSLSLILVLSLTIASSSTNFCLSCQMFLQILNDSVPLEQATVEKYTELLQVACNKYNDPEAIKECMEYWRPRMPIALDGFRAKLHNKEICAKFGDC